MHQLDAQFLGILSAGLDGGLAETVVGIDEGDFGGAFTLPSLF